MRKSTKANIYKCVIASAVGLLFVWYYLSSRWTEDLSTLDQLRVVCDAFTLPGIFMILFAMLCSINYSGGLDTLAYLMTFIPRIFAPAAFGEPQHLLDFVEERRSKRKKGYGFLYVVGSIFLVIALVLLALYFRAS